MLTNSHEHPVSPGEFFVERFSLRWTVLWVFTDHKQSCNKEINMHDPFPCSTTGYTGRLNTGGIPFQKINLLYSLHQPVSLHRVIWCVHTVNSVLAPSNSIDFLKAVGLGTWLPEGASPCHRSQKRHAYFFFNIWFQAHQLKSPFIFIFYWKPNVILVGNMIFFNIH